MGHWGACPLDFQKFNFSVHIGAAESVTATVWLPRQTYLYSATAAVVVHSFTAEPCSLYYFVSFYVQYNFHAVLCPPLPKIPPSH